MSSQRPKGWLINCREANRLSSRILDEELTWGERVKLRLHVMVCDCCINYMKQLKLLHKVLKKIAPAHDHDESIHLSQQSKQKIKECLNQANLDHS